MTVATDRTHALSQKQVDRLLARQQRSMRQSERLIRKGCGVQKMRAIVQMFISICGISIDLIVFIELRERKLQLNGSQLYSEQSYSIMKIDIFLLAPLKAFSPLIGLSLRVTSPSKQTLEPMFIFLNEIALRFWVLLVSFDDLHFLRFF